MPETLGTLDLKIARLKYRLKVLRQQLTLSRAYPDHYMNLRFEYSQAELELRQLTRQRQYFSNDPSSLNHESYEHFTG